MFWTDSCIRSNVLPVYPCELDVLKKAARYGQAEEQLNIFDSQLFKNSVRLSGFQEFIGPHGFIFKGAGCDLADL